jgi:hypothetical protein
MTAGQQNPANPAGPLQHRGHLSLAEKIPGFAEAPRAAASRPFFDVRRRRIPTLNMQSDSTTNHPRLSKF